MSEIRRVFDDNFQVYGVRKIWRQMQREGFEVARCTVARLMRKMGLQGVIRGKRVRTTIADKTAICPLDRVNRQFRAPRPNMLWVSDFTYVPSREGTVYVSFLQDVFSRRILGFTVATSMGAQLVTKALDQAISIRKRTNPSFTGQGVIVHSDAGSQGGFKWSSQHLGCGGVGWASRGSRCLRFRLGRGASGRRIGLYGRRCGHRAGRSRRVRCSVSSGA